MADRALVPTGDGEVDAIDHLKHDRLAEIAFEKLSLGSCTGLTTPISSAVNNLAVVHMKQRRLVEAETGFRRALRMKQSMRVRATTPKCSGERNVSAVVQLQRASGARRLGARARDREPRAGAALARASPLARSPSARSTAATFRAPPPPSVRPSSTLTATISRLSRAARGARVHGARHELRRRSQRPPQVRRPPRRQAGPARVHAARQRHLRPARGRAALLLLVARILRALVDVRVVGGPAIVRSAFNYFDRNRSGFLDYRELREALA